MTRLALVPIVDAPAAARNIHLARQRRFVPNVDGAAIELLRKVPREDRDALMQRELLLQ